MATSDEIITHHTELSNSLATAIGAKSLIINEVGHYEDWTQAGYKKNVMFELRDGYFKVKAEPVDDQDPIERRVAVLTYQEATACRSKGGDCRVFEVGKLSKGSSLWASWSEQWRSCDGNSFGLVGGGWTFFWRKETFEFIQLVRAEWDQLVLPDGQSGRGGVAGQPHWHVDLTTDFYSEVKFDSALQGTGMPSELTELKGSEQLVEFFLKGRRSETDTLSQAGCHLAMAGWCNQSNGSGSATPWQIQVDGNLSALRQWSLNTLEYIRQESKHL